MSHKLEPNVALTAYLLEQAGLHPSMGPQDVIKLCFQAAFGAEHLLEDPAGAERRLMDEFSAITGSGARLYERISPDRCRVNLAAWKQRGLPSEWLFRMFANVGGAPLDGSGAFERALVEVDALCAAEDALPFSRRAWAEALSAYRRAGGGAVHHSAVYHTRECPAYRLVEAQFIRLFPLLERMVKYSPVTDASVVALDGRAASGKTTMAAQLSLITGAGVVHMDDFFLPGPLRTPDRLGTPGGNVHYERFAQEVLPHIHQAAAFSYRRFDCAKMDFDGVRVTGASKWRIVEGAYSRHPVFGGYADITAFCDVAPQEQLHRIALRNGAEAARTFTTRWIPLEERYFDRFQIVETADIIL